MNAKGIWAVVPVKETAGAKQRLAAVMAQETRRRLALAMLEDVLSALSGAPGLAGIAVVTMDASARDLCAGYGARVLTDNAASGHTAAVMAAARALAAEGAAGMLTLPADIPLVTAEEVSRLLSAHGPSPAFTIAPARDGRGSNAVLMSPPGAVPLRFGDDSFLPHVAAAERLNIKPTILRLPGIGLDIDQPNDLIAFLRMRSRTRTQAFLDRNGFRRPWDARQVAS
jgi:2-phospho-L-lactate guanylyltransferase